MSTSMRADGEVDPNIPVLVGWQSVSRRDSDFRDGAEAADLMIEAAKSAGPENLLAAVDWVGTTEGLTRYADPARLVAQGIGRESAHTVLAKIGVMQQTLIAEACRRCQSGLSDVALVVGGEAHYRNVRATAAGHTPTVTEQPEGTVADQTISSETFDTNMAHPAEKAAGLGKTPGYYALIDSYRRASRGLGLDEHRDVIAQVYARFAEIAAENPHAVRRNRYTPEELRDPTPSNPMIAFPYTKLMVTTWTVDQACALIFATAATAEKLGVPRAQWRFPVIAVESNHVVPVAARTRLSQPSSIRIMADVVKKRTGIDPAEVELLDIYSAFPTPVMVGADGLGGPAGRDLTLTGGMSFAGGPLNSYSFHAVAAAADRLADPAARSAIVTGVSGYYSKQGLLMLSSDPPSSPFEMVDVTQEVAQAEPPRPIAENADGPGTVVAYTVIYAGDTPERAVAIIDLESGHRAVARSHDAALMESATTRDLVGAAVTVTDGMFAL